MDERERLERAIASLEAQRLELGDDVVEASLAALREKLARLEAWEDEAVPSPSAAGERRTVTVLFSDVTGSTAMAEQLDPEEWSDIMNDAFEHLTEPVHRFGGTVARLMGDAILAFFGAPVAHEDDPRRAVLAGLAILEEIRPFCERVQKDQELDFDVRVGINTGLAVVGDVGTETATEYTAMGDAVNVGARMEQTAEPGTVQITEQTYRLVAPYFKCQRLGRIEVKGKDEPVRAYRVLARKAEPEPGRGLVAHDVSSPLVGRESELAQARSAVDRLLAGEGGILSIIGEAGIGKSRLMAELREDVRAENLTWLEGHTLSYGQSISYWPFQEILRGYSGIKEDDGEGEAWHKLERRMKSLFPESAIEVLPYLATLLALEAKGEYAERVKYLDGQAMGQQVRRASRRFLKRLASAGPVVLVFEDLHWMDASSARLIERLLPLVEQVPLLLCGLSRPEQDTPATRLREIAKGEFAGCYTEIVLSNLSPEHGAHLVQNLLAIDGLPAHVRELILGKADGNPFFVEEIIRGLIEGGGVTRDPASGGWKVTTEVGAMAIPDTIQGVIIARIDRLDEEVKRVLRTAAVIGRSFLYRVLRAVVEGNPELDERLTGLQAAELIREKQRLPELEYVFKHALAQEAIYESILLKRRRELHALVGAAIEALFADRVQEFYGLLAYHYAQAEEWELAQDYLLKAGDQSGRVAAGEEALAHYRQAVAAYERAFGDRWDPIQRASIARKMGEAYGAQGQLGPSREHFLQSLKMLGQEMPTTTAGILFVILGQVLRQAMHRLWPARFLDRANSRNATTLSEASITYDRLADLYYFEADSVRLVYAVLRLLNLAEAGGPSPVLAIAYAHMRGIASQFPPARPLASLYGRLALEMAEGQDDVSALARVLFIDGIRNVGTGQWRAALDLARRAADVANRIGDVRRWEECQGTLGVVLNLKGHFEQGGKAWAELQASARERGDKQTHFWSLCGQATSTLRMGEEGHADAALALLKEAGGLLAGYAYAQGHDEIRLCGLLAQAHLRKGDVALALQEAESAAELIRAEPLVPVFWSFEGYVGPALVYLTLWEAQENGRGEAAQEMNYSELAWQACKELRGYALKLQFAQPRSWLFQGWHAWLAGKPGKAQRAWRKCLSYAEELNMPYEQGLAYYEIGRHLEPGDADCEKHLRRASDLFSRLDAAWDLARAEEALAGSKVT